MSLKIKLMDDLKLAMKNKEVVRKSVVTLLRAGIKQIEVDTRTELDDEGVIDIVTKQLKQRRDSLEEFSKAGRDDLVKETENEIKILLEYLPAQLSNEEVEKLVIEAVNAVNATSTKEIGRAHV